MAFTVDILTIKEAATNKAVDASTQTIEAIQTAAAENTIILDFDKTLFLRDSTVEYLNAISPRPLGAVYLLAISVLQPWQWLSRWIDEKASINHISAVLITLLCPWTLIVWRTKAKEIAQAHWNTELMAAIAQNPDANVVILTNSLSWIVNPLIQYLPSEVACKIERPTISCLWQELTDSAVGKLQKVQKALGRRTLARAAFITADSQNTALLSSVKTPLIARWAKAEQTVAMSDVYVPLVYSERVKNPGKSHIMKRVIAGHWAFLAIAFSFLSDRFFLNAIALLLLTLSYWCVYEIGYWENDIVGAKYESNPKLSKTFELYKDKLRLDTAAPWCWAIGLAVPAIVLLHASNLEQPVFKAINIAAGSWQTIAVSSAVWVAFLIAVRGTFWMYNRFNEEARIWIYPFLQTQKLFGFAILASTNVIGAVLLLSLVVSRWLHYAIYRCGGNRDRFQLNTCCLVLYILGFSGALISLPDPTVLFSWQAGVAFLYCLVRGIKGFHSVPSPIYLVRQQSVPPAGLDSEESATQPTRRITVGTYKSAVSKSAVSKSAVDKSTVNESASNKSTKKKGTLKKAR